MLIVGTQKNCLNEMGEHPEHMFKLVSKITLKNLAELDLYKYFQNIWWWGGYNLHWKPMANCK